MRVIETEVGPLRVVSTLADAAALWDWVHARRARTLGLDSETNAKDPWSPAYKLRTVQVGDWYGDRGEGWVIHAELPEIREAGVVRKIVNHHPWWVGWFTENDVRFIERGAPGSLRLGQHAPHYMDGQVALAYYNPRTITTASKKENIHPGITQPKGLKETSLRLCGTDILVNVEKLMHAHWHSMAPKGSRTPTKCKEWGFANVDIDDEIYNTYAGLDSIMTCWINQITTAELKLRGKWGAVCNDFLLQWHFDWMTFRGMLTDGNYSRWLSNELKKLIASYAPDLAVHNIKPSGAGAAIGEAFHTLGITSPKKTKEGNESWDKYVMADLTKEDGAAGDLARTITSVRKAGKYESTYVSPMIARHQYDGRLHPRLRAVGTITSRNASGWQQLPKKDARVRAAIIAPEGWVILTGDLEQGEPRVMAALSGDKNLLRDLTTGDLYSAIAALTYGARYNPAGGKTPGTVSYVLRQKAKFAFLAWSYGCGAIKLSELLSINPGDVARDPRLTLPYTSADSHATIRRWEAAYPDLVRYRDRMNRQYSVTLESGWVVPLWDRFTVSPEGELIRKIKPSRQGLNYPTQGNQRYLFATALRRIIDWGWSWALYWVMHDEVILCVPRELAPQAAAMLKAAMTMNFKGVPIECDVDGPDKWGSSWMPQPSDFNSSEIISAMEGIEDDELVPA